MTDKLTDALKDRRAKLGVSILTRSYCQIWCTGLMISGGFPADFPFIDTIDELDSGHDIGELSEAA